MPLHHKAIFDRFHAHMPDPQGELFFTNTFTLLVAVMLSAQSTDVGVNRVTQTLFQEIESPQDIIRMGEETLRTRIQTIGLYKTKAKNVVATAHLLVDRFDGQVPRTLEDLITLPGVGRKTANVVLNVAFQQGTMAVDTHVFRVARRLGLSKGTTPMAVEKDLMKKVPKVYEKPAHLWLVLHGRYVCKARQPLCQDCFLKDLCPSVMGGV